PGSRSPRSLPSIRSPPTRRPRVARRRGPRTWGSPPCATAGGGPLGTPCATSSSRPTPGRSRPGGGGWGATAPPPPPWGARAPGGVGGAVGAGGGEDSAGLCAGRTVARGGEPRRRLAALAGDPRATPSALHRARYWRILADLVPPAGAGGGPGGVEVDDA